MPRVTKQHERTLMNYIRRLLVMDPQMTNVSIEKAMNQGGIRIEQKYIGKLRRKIIKERQQKALSYTLRVHLQNFLEKMSESERNLWKIISGKASTDRDRINALKEVRQIHISIFEKLFEAGVFERQLGRLTVHSTILDLIQSCTDSTDESLGQDPD